MVLWRWEPFGELRQIHENMGFLWRRVYANHENGPEVEEWAMPLDVALEGDNIQGHASMPGVNPDDIDVTVENDVLTFKATSSTEREHKEGNDLMKERQDGAFHRLLRLPDTVNPDLTMSYYEQGALTVTSSKVEAKKAKKLTVTSSN